jgi:hypothetical protein
VPTYALTLSVTSGDARNALQSLLSTLNGYVFQDTTDPNNTTYWLGFGGTRIQFGTDKFGNPVYYKLIGCLGYNDDVAQNVQNLLTNLANYCDTLYFASPPFPSRAQIDARLLTRAGEDGADHYWAVHPGDNVTVANAAALLAKFQAVPGTS